MSAAGRVCAAARVRVGSDRHAAAAIEGDRNNLVQCQRGHDQRRRRLNPSLTLKLLTIGKVLRDVILLVVSFTSQTTHALG